MIMKKLSLVFLLLLSTYSFSQKEVVLDFKTKNWTKEVDCLNKGEFFNVVIKNINLNLYKVELIDKDTILSKTIETPTFDNITTTSLQNLVGSLTDNLFLNSFSTDSITQGKKKDNCNRSIIAFGKIIEELKNNANTIIDKNVEINTLKLEVLKQRYFILESSNKNSKVKEVTSSYILEEVEKINKSILEVKEEIEKNEVEFSKIKDENNSCIKSNKKYKTTVEFLEKLITESKAKIIEFLDTTKSENVEKLIKSISSLVKVNEFRSLPVQYLAENSKIKIKITPREEGSSLSKYSTSVIVPKFKLKNQWSVGTSFYYSNLKSGSFSILGEEINGSQGYRIIPEIESKSEIGVATLARLTMKSKEGSTGYNIIFGPGININKNIRPRLLIGGGLSFGDKNNISFDFGGIIGYVDKKSNIVDLNKIYQSKPVNTTVTRLDYGFFISIGYFIEL